MATQPHPPSPPTKSADPPAKPPVEVERKPSPPDPPVKTIADEQREGSAEMEKVGVEAWKKKWYKGPRDDDDDEDEDEHQGKSSGISKK